MKPQDRTRAILRSGLKPLERLLLIAICDYASAHGEAWPSIPTLVNDTGMGRRTIIRTLKQLDGRGLTINKTQGRSSVYRFHPESLPNPCQSGTSVTTAPVPERHQGGAKAARGVVPERHGGGARAAPEATNKRPIEATIEATKDARPASGPAGVASEQPDPVVSKSATTDPTPQPKPPPAPKPPSEAEQGLDVLRAVRAELHQQALSRKPRGTAWAKGKTRTAMLKRVKRYLAEVKAAELGHPLAALQALARWSYLAPGAAWLRERGGEPLDLMLGGPAGDPTSRLNRTREALDWHEGGESTQRRPAKGSGARSERQRDFLSTLGGPSQPAATQPPQRIIIN